MKDIRVKCHYCKESVLLDETITIKEGKHNTYSCNHCYFEVAKLLQDGKKEFSITK